MVSTRATASGSSKRKPARQANSSNDKGKGREEAHGQGPLQNITDYIGKLKDAAAELAEELHRLQEGNKELEDELAIEKEAAALAQHTRRGSTPASIAKLESTIKELKKENKKKDGIIAKMEAKEIRAEAEDLMDTMPNPETGEDMAATMRKLLRRYSDLMLVSTLGEEDDCSVCMDRMELKKCTALCCGHIFCNDCIKQILPKNEVFECPMCRMGTSRDDFEEVYMTETQRWDDLLKVAQAWDAIDHRPDLDTSEEEGEDSFITDASGDDEISQSNAEDQGHADASSAELDEEEEEGTDGTSTPTSSPPPRLAYSASPTKEKRKRLAELAERASKRRR